MESNEILAVVDSVSTEKGLEKDVIFKAIEVAIASASQRHFHEDADLYVLINRDTGEYTTHRNWIVFDESDEEYHHEGVSLFRDETEFEKTTHKTNLLWQNDTVPWWRESKM